MDTGSILRAAAERVRRPGVWAQGEIFAPQECASVAIEHATSTGDIFHSPDEFLDAAWFVVNCLGIKTRDDAICDIYRWNDQPYQTADKVADALEFCAVMFDQQQALAEVAQTAKVPR